KASPCSRCLSCLSLGLRRITRNNCFFDGNKSAPAMFYYVDVSGAELQPDSFEELAMPLFDQLYNFAHWLTQNREEAEDLVQETYAKALKGFSSFQLASKGCALLSFLLFLVPPSSAASPEPEVISFRSGEITLQGTLYKPEG